MLHFVLESAIYEKSNSPHLIQMIQVMWSRVGPLFNSLFTNPDFILHANTEHENMYAALSKRDGPSVRRHIVEDINVAAMALLPEPKMTTQKRRERKISSVEGEK